MNMLLLTIPAQHEGSNPAVLLDDKQLQKWMADLPVMNVVETVRALHQALVPFNEMQLDSNLRLKLLELYRQAIDEIFYSYDEMRLKQLPVSNEVRQEIKTDIMWLYLELANGYKIVVKNALDEELSPRKDSNLLLACYRAMEQIIHALVNAYRNHQAPPPLAYLEVNQLYLIAEKHGAADKKISSAKRESAAPTVNNLYKQFMLLAIADPLNMPDGMAFDLFFILEQFARQCRISDTPPQSQWVYKINLAEDELPVRLLQADSVNSDPEIRYFDAGPVIKVVNDRISELQNTEQDMMDTQEINILQFYSRQTSGPARTTEASTAKGHQKEVQLSFGLEATQYFMTDDHYFDYLSAGTESFGIEVRDVDEKEDLFELEPWNILEISKSGRMILVPRDITYQDIEMGMLIGIYEQIGDDKPPVFTLATVRWLPGDDSDEKKIGLQIIPGRPQPVTCAESGANTSHPCLHLPEVQVLNQPASLIVPASLYQKTKHVILKMPGGEQEVELLEIIDQTSFVSHCLYQ